MLKLAGRERRGSGGGKRGGRQGRGQQSRHPVVSWIAVGPAGREGGGGDRQSAESHRSLSDAH